MSWKRIGGTAAAAGGLIYVRQTVGEATREEPDAWCAAGSKSKLKLER